MKTQTFSINPGLKTLALIPMKWEKKNNVTNLYIFDVNMLVGYIRKNKNGKCSAHIITSVSTEKLGENLSADMAMQMIHNYLGLK